MAFLKINGITIPVAIGGASLDVEDLGLRDRTANLTLVTHRRGTKNSWPFRTTPVDGITAIALRDLLLGKPQVWSFDSQVYYSSKGLELTPSALPGAGGPDTYSLVSKYGGTCLFIGDTHYLTRTGLLASPWSVAVWVFGGVPADAAFHHYVIRSDGAKFFDGVRNDGLDTSWFFDSSGGNFKLLAAGYDLPFDDLIVMPSLMPAAWARALYQSAAAFGPAPRLIASGDYIEAGQKSVTVLGEEVAAELAVGNLGDGLEPVYQVKAKLREV